MINRVFGICCLVLCGITSAKAALATYTFTGAETDVPTVTDLTFGQFTRQNVTADTLAGEFRSSSWNLGTIIDTAQYVSFTITPALNRQFTFTDLTVDVVSSKRVGSHEGGPVHFDIRIFTLDGTTQLAALGDTVLSPNDQTQNVAWDFADLTSSSGFAVRAYGWQAETALGSLSFDNFAINGSVTPVPEPVNVALALFGLIALGATWARRALATRTA